MCALMFCVHVAAQYAAYSTPQDTARIHTQLQSHVPTAKGKYTLIFVIRRIGYLLLKSSRGKVKRLEDINNKKRRSIHPASHPVKPSVEVATTAVVITQRNTAQLILCVIRQWKIGTATTTTASAMATIVAATTSAAAAATVSAYDAVLSSHRIS